MRDSYNNTRRTIDGREYLICWYFDEDHGAPWEESDGHGIVSDWRTKGSKRPGERIMTEQHGLCRFYDWQATMKQAKAEGWGGSIDRDGCPSSMTTEEAVQADFDYLCAWCRDEWHYCGIEVIDIATKESAAVWGIESDQDAYHEQVITDLISELQPAIAQAERAKRLHDAAPELLAAAKALLTPKAGAWDELRAAIAKAEGGAR